VRILLAYRCSREGRSSEFERHLLSLRPDLVGISTVTFNRSASFELARMVRRLLPGATLVVGGPHASHLPVTILDQHPEIDFVAIGEGEHTLAELVDRLADGRSGAGLRGHGVESGSPRMLERLAKGIRVEQIEKAARATRRAGLEYSVYLITGAEGEEEEELAATEALLERIRPHGAVVSPLAVFPGTAVWEPWRRGRGLTDAAWDGGLREQVYARAGNARVRAAALRIGRLVSREASRNACGHEEIRRQRRLVGECHAVDLAEADLLEQAGRHGDAEIVLARLASRARRNPSGLLRLARLHLRTGRSRNAIQRLHEAAGGARR
jgi:radical SAM superfamily enzyme YgiQ (UPF0313 family)